MSFKVIIARDFDQMSEIAAKIAIAEIAQSTVGGSGFNLGLATGNTPSGLYKHLAKAANRGAFDASRIISFNLDEYIGLQGENAQQRALNPESYTYYMIQELFGLLSPRFQKTYLPAGTLIDQQGLDSALASYPDDWEERGEDQGRAIVIRPDATSPVLSWIRWEILDSYAAAIRAVGGIDLQIIGVGERGHVGFHEVGIPFDEEEMLLVRLDQNTTENSIADIHFIDRESCPRFAISMSAPLVYQARKILLVANGPRKSQAVARSLLTDPDPAIPISYAWIPAREGRDVTYVLDLPAATELLQRIDEIRDRGVVIEDISSQRASVAVSDLCFRRHPDSCRLT